MITSLTSNPAWWRKNLTHNRLTFYLDEPVKPETNQPPWVKEMQDKGKSFIKKEPKEEPNQYHEPPPIEPVKVSD